MPYTTPHNFEFESLSDLLRRYAFCIKAYHRVKASGVIPPCARPGDDVFLWEVSLGIPSPFIASHSPALIPPFGDVRVDYFGMVTAQWKTPKGQYERLIPDGKLEAIDCVMPLPPVYPPHEIKAAIAASIRAIGSILQSNHITPWDGVETETRYLPTSGALLAVLDACDVYDSECHPDDSHGYGERVLKLSPSGRWPSVSDIINGLDSNAPGPIPSAKLKKRGRPKPDKETLAWEKRVYFMHHPQYGNLKYDEIAESLGKTKKEIMDICERVRKRESRRG